MNTAIAILIFGGVVVLSGLLNEKTLAKIQTWLSWIFGLLTAVILLIFLVQADWHQAINSPSGSWFKGFLPAVSIVAAGSGISWSMAAAGWGAYVKPKTKPSATFWNTAMGGALPLFVLMVGGILLSTIEPGLSSASNPFDVMYSALPSWIGPMYFLVAAGGLIPQCIVSLRSAKINLATIGINISQKASLGLHGTIVIVIPIYVLFISGDFLSNFELYLNFLGICLASWVAIFLCDSQMFRKEGYAESLIIMTSPVKYNIGGIVAWIIATITGFLFTNNAIWTGPFAHGIFKDNSLGVFVSAIAAIICMMIVNVLRPKKEKNYG